MKAAALLVTAVATYETDITRELRGEVTALFAEEFKIANEQAGELFSASLHLLREAGSMEAEMRHILAPSKGKLNALQIQSLFRMLHKATAFEPAAREEKSRLVACAEKELAAQIKTLDIKWWRRTKKRSTTNPARWTLQFSERLSNRSLSIDLARSLAFSTPPPRKN